MVVNGEFTGAPQKAVDGATLVAKTVIQGAAPSQSIFWRLLPYMVPNRASMSSGALPTSMAAVCW